MKSKQFMLRIYNTLTFLRYVTKMLQSAGKKVVFLLCEKLK